MYNKSTFPIKGIKPFTRAPGFALIATISVMALLVMVALAMLSLSTIEIRESKNNLALAEARANARMALMLAIGELQKSIGPDQRITATANLLDPTSASGSASSTYSNQYWTGVWRSDDTKEPSDYDSRKTDLFENWLVSLRDPQDALNLEAASMRLNADHVVTMLGQGTSGRSGDSQNVQAEILNVSERGSIAWWVADESVKARLNLPSLPKRGDRTSIQQALLQSAPVSGAKMSESLEWLDSASDVEEDRENMRRLVTLRTLASHPKNVNRKPGDFHDFSTTAMSIPVNVREGGMKWDLSRLFGNDELPSDYRSNATMQAAGVTLPTGKPLYGAGNPQGAFPSWQRLADYHRLSQFVKWDGYTPYLSYETGGESPSWNNLKALECQPPLPVLVRMQLFFSLAARDGKLGLVIEPVCTFWNPYNVEIRIPYNEGVMRLFSWWPSCQITVNRGSKGNFRPRLNGWSAGVFQYSGSAGPNAHMGFDIAGMTLKPGETMVYSDVGKQPTHWNNRWAEYGRSVQAEPGWSETGGLLGHNRFSNSYGASLSGAETISVTADFEAIPTSYGGHFSQGEHLLFHRLIMYKAGPGVNGFTDPGSYLGLQCFGIHNINSEEYHKTLHTDGTITRNGIQGSALLVGKKEPLFVIDMAARSEQKSDARAVPTTEPQVLPYLHTSWSHGSIIGGNSLNESEKLSSYWEAFVYKVSDWDNQAVEIEPKSNRGFFGSGITAATGVNFVTMKEIPTSEPLSLAAYRNFDLLYNPYINRVGYGRRSDVSEYSADPATCYIIGGGYAHPLLGSNEVVRSNAIKNRTDGQTYDYFDHAYLANWALFDRYFHSGLPPLWAYTYQGQQKSERIKELREIAKGESRDHVVNPRFVWRKTNDDEVAERILDSEKGHERVGERLSFAGFNVNSTSVEAWRAFLGSMQAVEVPRSNGDALTPGRVDNYPDDTAAFPRQQIVNNLLDPGVLMSAVGLKEKSLLWNGFKSLESDEIKELAEAIVEQVKIRGPFFSMADFVNRRLSSGGSGQSGSNQFDLAKSSALQTAIDDTELNNKDFSISEDENSAVFANGEAAKGLRAAGAPAYLMQGDILQALGSAMTVRGDTFTVRAYGEAKDSQGNVISKAWCEAVVQRGADYVDPNDEAHEVGADLTNLNTLFGRNLTIISFRWLSQEEV